MELREVLLIIHILAALVAAAGFGAEALGTLMAGRQPDLQTVVRTARLREMGGRIAAFAMLVVLIAGTWLVVEVDAYEFDQVWISAAYAVWILVMGIGGGIMSRHAGTVRRAAEARLERGETTSPEVQQLWNTAPPKFGAIVVGIAFVVFVYLMVSKPGL